MDKSSELLNCLTRAVEHADRQMYPCEQSQKKATEEVIRWSFVDTLGPDFFHHYVNSDPRVMRDGIHKENLFVPRSASFRRATYGASNFDTQLAQLKDTFRHRFPGHDIDDLQPGLRRLRDDFAAQAPTTSEALVRLRALADGALRIGSVDTAYWAYQRLLTSKPYVREKIETIENSSVDAFFVQVKLSVLWCCALFSEILEGTRLAASLAVHQDRWYGDATEPEKDRYWSAIGILVAQGSSLLEKELADYGSYNDAERNFLWVKVKHVEQAWRRCCQHVVALGHAPWHRDETHSDGENNAVKTRILWGLSSFRKLRRALYALGQERSLPQVEKMQYVAVEDLLDDKFIALRPAQFSFSSYGVPPENLDRAYRALQRAADGECVQNRNYLISGAVGCGKSTLARAFAQYVTDESNQPNGRWGRPIRAFEMTYENILSSALDVRRQAIESYFAELAEASREYNFVPMVLIDDIDYYLGANDDDGQILQAFLSQMDTGSEDRRVFVLITTSDPQRIARALHLQMDGAEYREILATKMNALLESALLSPDEEDAIRNKETGIWSSSNPPENDELAEGFLPLVLSASYFHSVRQFAMQLQPGYHELRVGPDLAVRRKEVIRSIFDMHHNHRNVESEVTRNLFVSGKNIYRRGWGIQQSSPTHLGEQVFAEHWALKMSAERFWSTADLLQSEKNLPWYPLMSVQRKDDGLMMFLERNKVSMRRVDLTRPMTLASATKEYDILAWVNFSNGQDSSTSTIRRELTKQWTDSVLLSDDQVPRDRDLSGWNDFGFRELKKIWLDRGRNNYFDCVTFNIAISAPW